MQPIIPVFRERILRQEEARLLAIARQPSSQAQPAIATQLAALSFAEDLYDVHDVAAEKYEGTDLAHRAPMHRTYAAKAHQLKLLALHTLSQLTQL